MGRLVDPDNNDRRFYFPLVTPLCRHFFEDANKGMQFRESSEGDSETKKYLERIAKYIPAEVVSSYLLVDAALHGHLSLSAVFMVICMVAIPFYLNKVKNSGDSLPLNIVISMISFLIWSFCMEGSFFKMVLVGIQDKDLATYKSFAIGVYLIVCGLIPGKKE